MNPYARNVRQRRIGDKGFVVELQLTDDYWSVMAETTDVYTAEYVANAIKYFENSRKV
jgi:hypothetical protein